MGATEKPDIRYLFEPRSVAIIGASHSEGKIGYKIVDNIKANDYGGKIYPVNPKGGEILGHKVYRSIEDIDGEVDVAFVVVPARYVFDVVRECSRKGVKFLPIISSGFSEIGNLEEEKRIVEYARDHGMRILGPNIFGIYSARASLNGTFGPRDILPGNVAILSQSGALGIAMIGMSAVERIGLSTIVSIGNKSDLDEADLLDYLIEDDRTEVIMMYIEGIHDGQSFVGRLKRATDHKPVVVIKSGRSKRGAMAAASHTGSLAGADDIFDDVMRQCGVIRAEDLDEAFDWCKFMAESPVPGRENTVIVTNGGGIGVMATDACEKYDLKLIDDREMLREIFEDYTPEFGSTKNPVDITGGASAEDYRRSLMAALDNEEIGSVIALYCETALIDHERMGTMIREVFEKYKEAGKPILFSLVGGEEVEEVVDGLRRDGVPIFSDVYGAISCLGVLHRHHRQIKEGIGAEREEDLPDVEMDEEAIRRVIARARESRRHFLLSHEGAEIGRAAGIRMPGNRIARNLKQALEEAREIGFPVVMKIVSKDIVHKSDAGGVALDLQDEEEVMDAYQAIMHNARRYDPGAEITGVEISEMVEEGTEMIVGARRDPGFGPVVMFGLGGIYVEVMKDVSFRSLPIGRKTADLMVKSIKSYPLLLGVRGERRKDIDEVVDALLRIGAIIQRFDDISDIEANPLIAYEMGRGVKAVDLRILLERPEGSGPGHGGEGEEREDSSSQVGDKDG